MATVVGTAVFVGTSPLTFITGTLGQSAEHLVVHPFRDTFQRPIGATR